MPNTPIGCSNNKRRGRVRLLFIIRMAWSSGLLGEHKEMAAPEKLSQRFNRFDPSDLPTKYRLFLMFAAPAFFAAIVAELILWRMKPQWRRGLLCLSSFYLLHMIFILMISFDKDYGYVVLFVPPTIAATLLLRNLWPGMRQQSMGRAFSRDLDFMFNISAIIINLDSVISMVITTIITISGRFTCGPNKVDCIAVGRTGFFFFFAILLVLYLMIAAVFVPMTLVFKDKFLFLDALLVFLLVSTFIAASIAFVHFMNIVSAAADGEVPT